MDYELVTLNEKTVVGLCARTSNRSPDMGAVIGGLWQTYYQGGIYPQISGKKNGKALGIYSDYTGPDKSEYKVTVGCEADGPDLQDALENARAAAYDWVCVELEEDDPDMPEVTHEEDILLDEGSFVRQIMIIVKLLPDYD